MKRDRLLYIITRADRGGAQSHVLALIGAFSADYEVHLATGFAGPLAFSAQAAGATVHLIPSLVREISPKNDFEAVIHLIYLVRDVQPVLVHVHSSKAGIVGRLAARLVRVPAVFTAHGWAFTEGVGPVRRLMALGLEKIAARWAKYIVCVSEYDYRLALRYRICRPEQLRVIYNGVHREAPLASLEPQDTVVLVMVARFNEQKDQATVLRALSMLDRTAVRLVLVGNGPHEQTCRQLAKRLRIESSVDFLGDRSDVPEILAKSHVFVLATNWEGLPISIIEAMRARLPVVATKVGGVPELVVDGCTGFLVPGQNPKALAQALRALIDNPALRGRMAQSGRERFLAHFTLDRMVEQIRTLYRTVLDEQST